MADAALSAIAAMPHVTEERIGARDLEAHLADTQAKVRRSFERIVGKLP